MDKDYFNIAIIVLVVLAQLGGAVIAAWKKRQAAKERQERQERGEGLVVVQQTPAPSTYTRDESASWDAEDEDDPAERAPRYEDEQVPESATKETEQYWEEPVASPTSEAPRRTTSNAAAVASTSITGLRRGVAPEQPVFSHQPVTAQIAGKPKGISRARRIMFQGGLREAFLAQTILAPLSAARSLKR